MKKFHINRKGRVYKRGYHLLDTEIASIVYSLQKGKSCDEISEELKMDIRTIKKYESNSIVSRGGKVKVQNEAISLFFEEILKEDATLFLKEMKGASF